MPNMQNEKTPMPLQEGLVRITNFEEVALGYTEEQMINEADRCLHCVNHPCTAGCPVSVMIPDFIKALKQGKIDEAYGIITKTNSFPTICGRVCPQENQCEGKCILGVKGEPVAIGRLERFVADNAMHDPCVGVSDNDACAVTNPDLKVACIGSGPSSITVAGYLAARGIKVTVFEALHEAGGVLIYGIPAFRLPKDVVHREIDGLKELGVDFHLDSVGGRTFQIHELLEKYDAVFIGVGAGLPRFLGVPGENLVGVFSANEFLTRVNLGRAYLFPEYDTPVYRGRKVTVFGAGNVAMDAARTALRMGAEEVRVCYRRSRAEMPARLEEVEHAEQEGVQFEMLVAPLQFNADEEMHLKSVSLQRMELGEPDASGRRRPVAIPGSEFELETDLAIVALGTRSNPILLEATQDLEKTERGYIKVNEETGETSIPNVFAGGDIVTGAATVILAAGAGRRAGQAICRRLLGE